MTSRTKNTRHAPATHFREYAGVLTAFLTVIAFVLIGFAQMLAELFLGSKITAPPDWMAAMLSLASAALGFLIGKNVEKQVPDQSIIADSVTLGDDSMMACPHCGKRPTDEPV